MRVDVIQGETLPLQRQLLRAPDVMCVLVWNSMILSGEFWLVFVQLVYVKMWHQQMERVPQQSVLPTDTNRSCNITC
jgi:hypothetical protein